MTLEFERRFCLYTVYIIHVSLFVALTIQNDQHRLIDIQESPLISAEHDLNYDANLQMITLRRHSCQEIRSDAMSLFEQQFAQHIQNYCEPNDIEWGGETFPRRTVRRCHANALNWLKHFNIIRHKCQYHIIPQQRRFKMILRKTSSENELLLMTPTTGTSVDKIPTIRRSFSSGLVF